MNLVILAAGVGSRINMGIPKALIELANGQTILERQIDIAKQFISTEKVYVVTGYKQEMIIEKFPQINIIPNPSYQVTNTAESLSIALGSIGLETTIWINGDVVFDIDAFSLIANSQYSCMGVIECETGYEEIKFSTSIDGSIDRVSKEVQPSSGEAIGINKIIGKDFRLLLNALTQCKKEDYFERGIELAIDDGLRIFPAYINKGFAIEIDFEKDLDKVNNYLLSNDV